MIAAATISELVAAAFFVRSISLGTTILSAILAVGTLVAVVYGAKWKATAQTGKATADLWESNADAERVRAETAVADKALLQATIEEQRNTIVELRALPNVETLANVLALHEQRAQERQSAILETVHNLAAQNQVMHDQHATLVGVVQQLVDHLAAMKGAPQL